MPYLFLTCAALVWGGSFAVGKILVGQVDPFVVAWVRFVVASAAFAVGEAAIALRAGRKPAPPAAPQASPSPSWSDYALLGLTGTFGYNALFFYGLTLTTATESSLICGFAPVVTAIIGFAFLGERINRRKAGGIVLSVVGVALVILGATSVAAGTGTGETAGGMGRAAGRLIGDLLQVASVLCWAVYNVVGKRVLEHASPFKATARATYWGALFFTVTVAVRPGSALLGQAASLLGPRQLPGLLYLALVCTVFGFVAWYRGLEATDVSGAAVFLNLIPVSTLLIAAVTLGERLAPVQLGGGVLVVAGVMLVSATTERPAARAGSKRGPRSGEAGR